MHHGDSPEYMSKEMGMSLTEVKRLIEVYSFMDDHQDTAVQHWSYYYEYLKSRKIQTQRELNPEFDAVIVKRVMSGEISRAEDIRDKVTKIAGAGPQIFDDFINKPFDLVELSVRVKSILRVRYLTDELERVVAYVEELQKNLP